MSTQESLTFLFDAIACGFVVIATIDLSREIIALYKQIFVAPPKALLNNSQPQQLSQLPAPWLLPTASALAPVELAQVQQKPVLLLAQAKAINEGRLPSTQSATKELLIGVDIDTLKLREARKLAKSLGIAQKVNGKGQTLAFLRSQIKAKLQQETSRLPEVVAQLRAELVAC